MSQVKARLESLGITLPAAATPVANYVSYTRSGNIVNISGQISVDANGGIKGTVGVDVSLEDGVAAARICGLNLLAQMQAACDGDLDNVVRVLKLNAFVQAGPDFYDIPKVINGCSDLMVEVLGEAGKHARSAVGMYKIPLGFAVEIDAQIEVKDRR
ncbi:RidA family protein [Asticcacaulis machinosus]|uniref:RidA family protein n=1 Tax=Asticcacaulis machinosus TaxID=2984211 RepID=A0ABT5HHF1_9CAUL|nr:RidA family protein [Asticcacaulis machinosus]MDC7675674.1 RidA family protein [Asticcacaulis machinosus]